MKRGGQSGFTIVELMIATAVFSVILLIITAGVLAFSKQYMHGQTYSNLQFTARQVSSQVGQDIQFGNGVSTVPANTFTTAGTTTTVGCYQIGASVYLYHIGRLVEDNKHGLVMVPNQSATGACNSFIPLSNGRLESALNSNPGARELLSQGQRLLQFSIIDGTGAGAHVVEIKIASGDDDLFTPDITPTFNAWQDVKCKPTDGREYCAITSLKTTALERI